MGDIADMMLEGDLCAGCGVEQADRRPGPAAFKCPKRIRTKIEALGTLHQHDAYHWTVRVAGKVIADWWPRKRQWRIAGKTERGDETQFVKALGCAEMKNQSGEKS